MNEISCRLRGGIEINRSNKVAVAESRVELESDKGKEDWERKLKRSTTFGLGV